MKSIVLLSGGLDSAVSLTHALKETEVALCLTFDYGQLAAKNEIMAATALAKYYKVRHRIILLPFLKEITDNAITSEQALHTPNKCGTSGSSAASSLWVPNRNGLFINIAAAFAEAYRCNLVITGFNREEAVVFPDNSPEFVRAANSALSHSTLNKVKVISYTQRLNKEEIVRLGIKNGLPFYYLWSCYRGGKNMCGRCDSCLRFTRAAKSAGLELSRVEQ